MKLVIIDSEERQESQEDGGSAEEMPRIVSVVEVKIATLFVEIARFRRGQISIGGAIQIELDGKNAQQKTGEREQTAGRNEHGDFVAPTNGIVVFGVDIIPISVLPKCLTTMLVLPEDVVRDVEEEVSRQNEEDDVSHGFTGI